MQLEAPTAEQLVSLLLRALEPYSRSLIGPFKDPFKGSPIHLELLNRIMLDEVRKPNLLVRPMHLKPETQKA